MMRIKDVHAAWRALPVGHLSDIIGKGSCLILAPHADDESLGCGGLIAASIAVGRPPVVVILTDGAGSHPGSLSHPPERLRALRRQEARDAMHSLGLPEDRLVFLNAPDSAAPTEGPAFDDAAHRLAGLLPGVSAILSPWRFDPHCDHEAAWHLAARVAGEAGIRHIAYPVWGWRLPGDRRLLEPPPSGWRMDIRPWLEAKRAAIAAHRSQHGQVILDDPGAFVLPSSFLALFDTPFETFVLP